MRMTAAVTKGDGLYVAQCLDVDVASQGATVDEALADLREALGLRFEDGVPPNVTAPIIAPIEVNLPRPSWPKHAAHAAGRLRRRDGEHDIR